MNHGGLYGKSMIPNELMNILNENAYLHRNNFSFDHPYLSGENKHIMISRAIVQVQ